jgi:hypothetical protein
MISSRRRPAEALIEIPAILKKHTSYMADAENQIDSRRGGDPR